MKHETDNENKIADPENLYIYQVLRHLIAKNKNNFLKFIKSRWTWLHLRSHMKTDNPNSPADPKNCTYICVPGFQSFN